MNSAFEAEITRLHAEICGGLADPTRIMLLYELSAGPKNVSDLANQLNLPQSLASRHLKILRERGMVTTERQGTVIIYSLADVRLIQALDLLRDVMRDTLVKRAALLDTLK